MALRTLSTAALRRELARREAGASKLARKRDKLAKALAAMDAELAGLGMDGAPKRRGRSPGRKPGRRGPGRPKGSKNKPKAGKRAKNKMSLIEAIVSGVRVGSTVSPADAAVAAKRAGYKSSSPNLAMMCANAMGKSGAFRHAGRGQYVLKGGTAKAGKPATRGRKARSKPGRPKGSKNGPTTASEQAVVTAA